MGNLVHSTLFDLHDHFRSFVYYLLTINHGSDLAYQIFSPHFVPILPHRSQSGSLHRRPSVGPHESIDDVSSGLSEPADAVGSALAFPDRIGSASKIGLGKFEAIPSENPRRKRRRGRSSRLARTTTR